MGLGQDSGAQLKLGQAKNLCQNLESVVPFSGLGEGTGTQIRIWLPQSPADSGIG